MVGVMDQYIEMCKAATEIQILWEPNRFDVYSERGSTGNIIDPAYMADKHRSTMTWLPRIEDLFEMLTPEGIKPYLSHDISPGHNNLRAFHGWSTSQFAAFWEWAEDMSIAELLLWFVMDTLYNKSWNGNVWESLEAKN